MNVPSERQQDAAATAGGMPALRGSGAVAAHFVNASFGGRVENSQALAYARATDTEPLADDPPPPPQFNNCAICHQTPSTLPKFGNRQPHARPGTCRCDPSIILPRAQGFSKARPRATLSCFSCHYQGQKPIRTDCAGCHRPAAAVFRVGCNNPLLPEVRSSELQSREQRLHDLSRAYNAKFRSGSDEGCGRSVYELRPMPVTAKS